MGKRGRSIWCVSAVLLGAVFLGGWLLVQPGKIRYRNAKEAEWNETELVMDGRSYIFYGALEQDTKRKKLIAYAKDEEGYYWEFYSVSGKGEEWLIATRRGIMGDTFLLKEN